MTPRLMFVCLGGLAGVGALVCCDMDEGAEALEAQPADETPDTSIGEAEPADGEPAVVH